MKQYSLLLSKNSLGNGADDLTPTMLVRVSRYLGRARLLTSRRVKEVGGFRENPSRDLDGYEVNSRHGGDLFPP